MLTIKKWSILNNTNLPSIITYVYLNIPNNIFETKARSFTDYLFGKNNNK